MTDIDMRPWKVGKFAMWRMDKGINELSIEPIDVGAIVYTADQVRELLRRERERCAKAASEWAPEWEPTLSQQAVMLDTRDAISESILALPDEELP